MWKKNQVGFSGAKKYYDLTKTIKKGWEKFSGQKAQKLC